MAEDNLAGLAEELAGNMDGAALAAEDSPMPDPGATDGGGGEGGGDGGMGASGGGDGGGGNVPAAAPVEDDHNLDLILDIPLRVTVELGRTRMIVRELLNLGQGSVIELNKLAGEPMEILVNDKLVARGEAVVVNEKFGVRLTDIISPQERVEQLK